MLEVLEGYGFTEITRASKNGLPQIDRIFVRDAAWEAGALRYAARYATRSSPETHPPLGVQVLQVPSTRLPPLERRFFAFAVPTTALEPSVRSRELARRLRRLPPGLPGAHSWKCLCPDVTAKAMASIVDDLAGGAGDCVSWEQLLVWIPKTPGAVTPEDMRPLGLPTTLIRTICVVLYRKLHEAWSPSFHPAQSLTADVKDPALPFLRAEAHWHQAIALTASAFPTRTSLPGTPLRGVLPPRPLRKWA